MATIAAVLAEDTGKELIYTWTGLAGASNDVGAPVRVPVGVFAACVNLRGTLSSTTIAWEGSFDGTNWAAVDDIGGAGITASTDQGVLALGALPLLLRPAVTGGLGTGLVASLMMRKA